MQKTLLIISIAFVIVTGCKKNKTSPNNEPAHRVKTYTPNGGTVNNYEYDSEGRIAKVTEGSWRWEYVYTNNLATENVYQNGMLVTTNHHELNSQGLNIKTTLITPPSSMYFTYTYNSSKMLTKEEIHDGSDITKVDYYYSSKRLDSARTFSNGILAQRALYEYSDTNNTIGNQHFGFQFQGYSSPKAKRKLIYYFYDAAGTLLNVQTNNYSYELDAQGRITREMMNSTPAGIARDISYTYY
ncbi:MAG TPA: hypothetical protein VHM26_11385 [Chitinophagaceae bacterium]|jgi:hypothetical protein|nr:hypothetical protein [Chitinophagaceae bacterium]